MFGWNFLKAIGKAAPSSFNSKRDLQWTGKLLLLIPWHWGEDKKNRKKARVSFSLQ